MLASKVEIEILRCVANLRRRQDSRTKLSAYSSKTASSGLCSLNQRLPNTQSWQRASLKIPSPRALLHALAGAA